MYIRRVWIGIAIQMSTSCDIFHIGPGISPRLPYQARQRRWKISCHNLFITYFTLTFSKHWLLYCKKYLCDKRHYHIFCCNMFVFACPIRAKSQYWLVAHGQITCPHIPVFDPGICAVVSKIMHKIVIQSN
jgi:hypothetical protein